VKKEIISAKWRNCGRKKMGVGKATAICAVNLRYPCPNPTYNLELSHCFTWQTDSPFFPRW